MQSVNPVDRILGIRAAVERGDRSAVPHIVDRLEDEDDGVRFFAIIALDRITGERFGYDYAKPATERAAAVGRWREYVHGSRNIPAGGDQQAAASDDGAAPAGEKAQ